MAQKQTKQKLNKKYFVPKNVIHQEILKQLDERGWDMIMIGGDMVIKNQSDPQPYKYWYVVPFLGSNKSHKEELNTTKLINGEDK